MMKNLMITCLLLLTGNFVHGQYSRFPTSGTIEYEKTVNMLAIVKQKVDLDKSTFSTQAFEGFKKNNPQFKKLKSTLTFGGNKTLFTPLKDTEPKSNNYLADDPAADQNNVTYTDLLTSQSITQKLVFEETFLLKDSVRKINWKITEETRDIAGYSCRRANALIMDSIYVVAFYTDEIPLSGGPESFTGLPGMILGVALPYEHITWFATLVKDLPVAPATITAPKKGKSTDYKSLISTLQGATKNWGNYAQFALKAFLL
jgi:GLPGLI family protein